MKPIVIIAPNEQIFTEAKKIEIKCSDVHVELGNLDQAVNIAKAAEKRGSEIFISRGGTATAIHNALINSTVIDILVSPYDVVNALHRAKSYGKNICVIGFENIIRGVESLGPILDINILANIVHSEEEVENCLLKAKQNYEVDVVLGGSITEKLAIASNIPTVPLLTSIDTIETCIQDARRILSIKRQERAKTEQLKTILFNINEGVIAINKKGEVTTYNLAAEKITGIKSEKIMGKIITDYITNSNLIEVMKNNNAELGQLQNFGATIALTNRVPIKIKGETVGAVATFADVTKIQEYEQTIRKNLLNKGHVAKYSFNDIIGTSKSLLQIKEQAEKYALVDSTILIFGESGTGKEMFAHSIHQTSNRSKGPFVAVNCAAIPANLLESELFGYEDGAFTGAKKEGKDGLFALAHKGTIFLDEIGEIPTELQARLLRVLQEREIRPLGSSKVISIDVRIIAATNKSLIDEVKSGNFRKDLYYRLNILKLEVPSLYQRSEDICLLAHHFLKKNCIKLKKDLQFSDEAITVLKNYSWPGNVRELENTIERLAILSSDIITKEQAIAFLDEYEEENNFQDGLLKNIKREVILETLDRCEGNRTLTAKKLGISRTQLWRYLKE